MMPHGFSIDGNGYIGGGFDEDAPYRVALNDFYRYDPLSDSWTQVSNYHGNTNNSYSGACEVSDNKSYISFTDQDFYSFDPAGNDWNQLVISSGALYATCSSFVIGNNIYYVGGHNLLTDEIKADVWIYNTIEMSWEKKNDFPGGPRIYGVGFMSGNFGFVGLGYDGSRYYDDMWKYNPENDTWTQVENFPGTARSLSFAFKINNKIYIGTGLNSSGQLCGDMYCFNPLSTK